MAGDNIACPTEVFDMNRSWLLLLLAAVPLAAQEPVIRLDVNLVQVDAVVTDSHNKHVGNLTANDFEILQDGKPQKITNFSWIAPGTAAAARGAVTPPPVAVPLPKPAEVRRTLAF